MSDEIRLGVFLGFGMITLVSGAVVALARTIIYSVFALLFTFFGVAGLYVLLHADFLAATQVMIYVGGILVLLLFGVMLTHKIATVQLRSASMQRGPAALICGGLLALLLYVIFKTPWPVKELGPATPTVQRIGRYLMTDYLLAFEVISVLLFAVLVGAALMARRETNR
ncbi:MAG: NADH-quinone oxidoreductase subunit J [Candidatus Eisenbacteria bacterium]|nr:NADH-quinone oxidoreductase subunit J [Candidatus Latescibacterota bacterium]MBD3302231.1 NADH-quinone oxidoreductase subunit J [Candidatus Eisenbacteria bacterium]